MRLVNTILGICGILLLSVAAQAATVTLVGADETTNADWRKASVAKANDLGGDNVYGSDGFILFEWNHDNWDWSPRNAGKDLVWLPTYITSITDDFINGYRNDNVYGQLNDLGNVNTNHPGTVASGAIYDFNTVTIKRNGNTGAFRLTVFASYDLAEKGPEQVWVHSSGNPDDAVEGFINYETSKTKYVSFDIGAGSDDVTVRVYSGANHLSGIAFDGLTPRPYSLEVPTVMHYDCNTVSGQPSYTAGGVTISGPTLANSPAYEGSGSAAIDFNTGGADATYGAVEMWASWKVLPLNMKSLEFASYAPAGTTFHISIEDDDWNHHAEPWWGIHHTPIFTQATNNGWQVNKVSLAELTEPIDPATLGAKVGTVRVYIHGAAEGGQQGASGTLYLDAIRFTNEGGTPPTPTPNAAKNWAYFE